MNMAPELSRERAVARAAWENSSRSSHDCSTPIIEECACPDQRGWLRQIRPTNAVSGSSMYSDCRVSWRGLIRTLPLGETWTSSTERMSQLSGSPEPIRSGICTR